MNTYEEDIGFPPMISARMQPSAELINDSIYVFGGLLSECGKIDRTVERYAQKAPNLVCSELMILIHIYFLYFRFEFAANKWTEVTPMSLPRRFSAHVVLSDRLFVIGGNVEQNQNVNSVENYDPLTDKWESVAPMQHIRSGAAACVAKGFIYVFGGWDAKHLLQSMERYEPGENTWTKVGCIWRLF